MRSITVGLVAFVMACSGESDTTVTSDSGVMGTAGTGGVRAVAPPPDAATLGGQCSPGTAAQLTNPCGLGPAPGSGIPNGSDVGYDGFALPEAMHSGQKCALSARMKSSGATFSVEVWGTDSPCGHADELLWWGEMQNGTECAEFVPAHDHSRLLFVVRTLVDGDSTSHFIDDITICPTGSCPSGRTGHGLMPGATLTAPLGPYSASGGGGGDAWAFDLDGEGHIITRSVPGTPGIASGILRMPPDDPFGDGWYCIGAGSTVTSTQDGSRSKHSFSFKSISKLGTCTGKTGNGNTHASIVDFKADLASTFPELTGTGVPIASTGCAGTTCFLPFEDTTALKPVEVTTATDLGTYSKPTRVDAPVALASWFYIPQDGSTVRLSCAASGSIHYNPAATTTVQIDGMSDFVTCPGAPVTPSEWNVDVE